MSSQESSDDCSAITQDSSDSEAENLPDIQSKSKSTDTAFWGWKFTDTMQADVGEGEFQEKKRQLIEHFRTQTTANRLTCVLYVTIFANLYDLFNASPGDIHTVSIVITGYVQISNSCPATMAKWIPCATWIPVPCGLCSCSEFQDDTARHNNEKSTTFQLPIIGERQSGLQKREKRTKRRQNRKKGVPHRHLSRTYIMISVSHSCEQKVAKAEKDEERRFALETQPPSRGRVTPSPADTAVAGRMAFVCTFSRQGLRAYSQGPFRQCRRCLRQPPRRRKSRLTYRAPSRGRRCAGLEFVCAVLCKLCVSTLGGPYGSVAGAEASRGDGTAADAY